MRGTTKVAVGVGTGIGAGGTILSIVLIILGVLLSLTGIGAIIGIPLIIIGIAIMVGAFGTATLIGTGAMIDEARDTYHNRRKTVDKGYAKQVAPPKHSVAMWIIIVIIILILLAFIL